MIPRKVTLYGGGIISFCLLVFISRNHIPFLRNRRPRYYCTLPILPALVEDSYHLPDPTNRLYFGLIGRLGNNLMELASVYGLARDSGRKIFIADKSFQSNRILKLFPRLKDILYFVPCLPPAVEFISEEQPNKFSPNIIKQIQASNEDLIVSGYLGKSLQLLSFQNICRIYFYPFKTHAESVSFSWRSEHAVSYHSQTMNGCPDQA